VRIEQGSLSSDAKVVLGASEGKRREGKVARQLCDIGDRWRWDERRDLARMHASLVRSAMRSMSNSRSEARTACKELAAWPG